MSDIEFKAAVDGVLKKIDKFVLRDQIAILEVIKTTLIIESNKDNE